MTCIVGLVDAGKVYLGSDCAGVGPGWSLSLRDDAKVFFNGDFLIGFSSSFRMGQLLRYEFVPPARHGEQDIYAYMVTTFVSSVRQCLKEGGFAERDKEAEKGGQFLVGYEGRIFSIESDYQVGEEMAGFSACGCGYELALGALYATGDLPPIERVKVALKAAERFSAGVRGPFKIEVLG